MTIGLRHRVAMPTAILGAGLVAQPNRAVGRLAMPFEPGEQRRPEIKVERFVIIEDPNDTPVHDMGVRVGIVALAQYPLVPISERGCAWLWRDQPGPRTFPRRLIKMAVYDYVTWLIHYLLRFLIWLARFIIIQACAVNRLRKDRANNAPAVDRQSAFDRNNLDSRRSSSTSRDGEAPLDRGFALLVDHLQFALDQLLAMLFALAGDLAATRQRIAGPYLPREANLETPNLSCARIIGQAARETSRSPHALRKHGRDSRRLDEGLIVMQRDEIARRARVTHEIGPRHVINRDGRSLVEIGRAS